MIRRPPNSTLFPYPTLSRPRQPLPPAVDGVTGEPEVCGRHTAADRRCSGIALDLVLPLLLPVPLQDRKSTRLNSSHANISYAVFCLKKKNKHLQQQLVRILH